MSTSWRTWLQAVGALAFGYVAALLTFWAAGNGWSVSSRNAAISLIPSVIALLARNPLSSALGLLGIQNPSEPAPLPVDPVIPPTVSTSSPGPETAAAKPPPPGPAKKW